MKRILSLLLIFVTIIFLSSCTEHVAEESSRIDIVPNVSRMKSICELAVIDCYYHNIAKSYEPDVEGHLWWKKDRLFWIEYDAIAKYGIDVSNMGISIEGDLITVSIPQAKLLECTIDDPKNFKYIVAEDSAKITAENERNAISKAQDELKEKASNDTMLILQAQQRAEDLLKEYIDSINELGEKSYKVEFTVITDDANQFTKTNDNIVEQPEITSRTEE